MLYELMGDLRSGADILSSLAPSAGMIFIHIDTSSQMSFSFHIRSLEKDCLKPIEIYNEHSAEPRKLNRPDDPWVVPPFCKDVRGAGLDRSG